MATENHIGRHSLQLRTGNWGYNSHGLTKMGQKKIGKNVAWSDESRFQLQHSDDRVRISILPYINGSGWWRWRNSVGDIFLAHFRLLSTNWATASLSIVALPIFNEFTVLQWPPQSPDLNPIEHLWDVVEREICIIDVQPTYMQWLRSSQYGPKSPRTVFNILSNLCHRELRQFWRQKGVQPSQWV